LTLLLMAQALERAGDHTTNLAEDLYSLIEGAACGTHLRRGGDLKAAASRSCQLPVLSFRSSMSVAFLLATGAGVREIHHS